MITYHRRAATNRLNRDCLSSSPSVCNVFINAQCHLYSVNSRRAPHAEAERETQQGDGHTRTHDARTRHTHTFIFTLIAFLRPFSTHPMPQHQPNTRRVLGCWETPPWGVVTNTILLHLLLGLVPGLLLFSERPPPHSAGPGARACARTHETTTSGTPCRLLHMYMCIVQ